MYYKNMIHKKIFEEQVTQNPCKCSGEYLATLYLLTADKMVWDIAKRVIDRKEIDFSQIRPKTLSTKGYTIYAFAKDIYSGSMHVTLQGLCDNYLIPTPLFELLVTAMRLYRVGYEHTGIVKEFD